MGKKTLKKEYVHGYANRESVRLQDQASTLTELLHYDTVYPDGSLILEAGCGVGAQTITLAKNSPKTQFCSIDISDASIEEARNKVVKEGITNVQFQQADIFNLPFKPETFDHIFVCFVLEHLQKPEVALQTLKKYLKPGGTITVIEGDHGSTFFYPDSEAAHNAIQCQVQLQKAAGGNANIGRELYPLLSKAGYDSVEVSPRMVYVDSSRPQLVEGFIKKTFIAMIEGVRESAINSGLIKKSVFEKGVKDLYRTADPDGVFCYTFFKALGKKL